MEFKFDINAKCTRVTDRQLIEDVRACAAARGNRPFTMREYTEWPGRRQSPHTVVRRLGSWRRALRLVGIENNHVRNYTAEELVKRLEEVWRTLGRPPGTVKLRELGGITREPFDRHWGSLRKACQRLALYHGGHITREELLAGGPSGRPKRRSLSVRARWRILDRDGNRCTVCGRSPAAIPGLQLEVDHIRPVSEGGTDDERNLRTLCADCNRGKGGRVGRGTVNARIKGEAQECASRKRGRPRGRKAA